MGLFETDSRRLIAVRGFNVGRRLIAVVDRRLVVVLDRGFASMRLVVVVRRLVVLVRLCGATRHPFLRPGNVFRNLQIGAIGLF